METLESRATPAVHQWTGAASNLWSNAGNWTNGAPAADATPTLVFPAGAANLANQNDLSAAGGGKAITQIQFTGGGYNISGNVFRLGAQGITTNDNVTNTLSNAMTLTSTGASTTFSIGTGSALTLGGVLGGTKGLTKTGAGTLALSGANTYTSTTDVATGTLNVRNGAALGPGGFTVVRDGATLELQGTFSVQNEGLQLGLTDSDPVGTTARLRSTLSTQTWGGSIVLQSNAAITVGTRARLIVSGPLQGTDDIEFQTGDLLVKDGPGQLELRGNNTYTATTEVQQGSVLVQSATAFGATSAGTTVLSGASILLREIDIGANEFVGVNVGAEPLALNGSGLSNLGALRNLSGLNGWAGPITLASNSHVGVDSGELRLSGVLSGTATLTKVGADFLTLNGTSVNTFTGTTQVNAGTLILNKPAAVAGGALQGPLVVGDGVGGANADVVRLEGNDQIGVAAVTVNSSGILNLNNKIDALGPVTLVGGNITTGTGQLVLSANLASNASAGPATISGKISFPGSRTFTVADGGAADDLIISAVISGNTLSTDTLTKAGAGRLVFSGNNLYNGITVVSAGSLIVNGVQPQSPVRVQTGSLLGGSGTVGTVTALTGAIGPGDTGPGRLTSSNLSFDAASSYVVQINGTAAASGHDQLKVNGTVNLGGSSLSVTLGFASAVNNFYIIVDNDGTDAVVNTFNGLPEGGTLTTSSGVVLQISYVGGDGNDVVLRHVNTAPAFADRSVTARVREGGIAILTGTITESDPQDTFFLDVNWGDGTPVETFTFLPGTPRTIQVSHRYLDDGRSGTRSDVARIQLLWRDQNGGSNRDELSTTVVNVPPRLSNVTLRPTSRQRRRARLRGIITDSGRKDTLRVLVRWGDGTTSTQTLRAVRGRLLFSLDHTYRRPGTYRVTLSVRDDDTGSAVLTRVITFNARPTIDVPRRG